MDALYHEHFYFHSTDYLQSGYGWSLASSYLTFPFLATLATRYTVTSAVRTCLHHNIVMFCNRFTFALTPTPPSSQLLASLTS